MGGKYALIIGNSEFQDMKFSQLTSPSKDADQMASLLLNEEICDFDNVNTSINQPEQVLRRAIARLFSSRDRDDLLLLYISGHGVKDEQGELHFACIDTEFGLLSATAIPAYFIRNQMERSNSKRQVLILDCCYSGAFRQGTKAALGEGALTNDTFNAGYGRIILTASNSVQYAFEGDRLLGKAESSIFTSILVNGLRTGEADIHNRGVITVEDLYQYIFRQIGLSTIAQTPQMWADKLEGSFTIAYNPKALKQNDTKPELSKPLVGNYKVQLFGDNSIVLPSNLQNYFSDGYFITQGFDRCLMILTDSYFKKVYERLNAMNLADPTAKMLRRLILSNVYPGEIDPSGMMTIPGNLVQFAISEKEVVINGQGEYAEVWSVNEWQKQLIDNKDGLSQESLHSLHLLLRAFIKQS